MTVPFDKPEVLSSCSADWLLAPEVCPDQKCNKLEFPNRHQGATCPDSARPVYFSTLHFLLGTSIANHPYLWRKQNIYLKFSFYNSENNFKILILTGSHQQKKHWQSWKIFIRVIPSITFWETSKVSMRLFRLQQASFIDHIIHAWQWHCCKRCSINSTIITVPRCIQLFT